MRARSWCGAGVGMLFVAAALAEPPPLATEHLEVARLPSPGPHWAFIYDMASANQTDARVLVYDGDRYTQLGQIDGGYWPNVTMSADRKTTAVVTTYFSRGWHGTRTDVVEFNDNTTLVPTREIVLPPKRMTGPPSDFTTVYSADQRFLYVANLTPAASFTVVDLTSGKIAGEVETDGCVLVIPSGTRRVSSLCESGRLLTVTLDDSGHEASRSLSQPFFDADKDPIFVQGLATGGKVLFVSFLGDLYSVDLRGAEPKFAAPWRMVADAERGKWRPSGNQLIAFHAKRARLYVPMHRAGEGMHKEGGTEIWVYDTDRKLRVARWPIETKRSGNVVALHVTPDDQPVLFALTENATLLVMDPDSGHIRHVEEKMGQSAWYFLGP